MRSIRILLLLVVVGAIAGIAVPNAKALGFEDTPCALSDPANPQRVFLATQTHGIWYSIDGGVTGSWSELDVDIGPSLSGIHARVTLPFSAYTDVDIVPSDRPGTIEMYATTFGAGAYLVVARQPGL